MFKIVGLSWRSIIAANPIVVATVTTVALNYDHWYHSNPDAK